MGMHFLAITAGGFGWVRVGSEQEKEEGKNGREEQGQDSTHWLRLLSAFVVRCVCTRSRLNCYIVCAVFKYEYRTAMNNRVSARMNTSTSTSTSTCIIAFA